MITCAILDMLTAFVNSMFGLLPDWTVNISELAGEGAAMPITGVGAGIGGPTSIEMVLVWMSNYNTFVPFDHLIVLVGIMAGFVGAVALMKGIKFVVSLCTGGGGG